VVSTADYRCATTSLIVPERPRFPINLSWFAVREFAGRPSCSRSSDAEGGFLCGRRFPRRTDRRTPVVPRSASAQVRGVTTCRRGPSTRVMTVIAPGARCARIAAAGAAGAAVLHTEYGFRRYGLYASRRVVAERIAAQVLHRGACRIATSPVVVVVVVVITLGAGAATTTWRARDRCGRGRPQAARARAPTASVGAAGLLGSSRVVRCEMAR
jgi:hypothetical protein